MSNKITKFERNIKANNEAINQFQKKSDLLQALKTKVDSYGLKIRDIETYLDKYVPLYNLSQFSETLSSCLSEKYLRKLAIFEEKKIREFNHKIVHDDGRSNISKRIDKIYDFIEPILNKYEGKVDFTQLAYRPKSKAPNVEIRTDTPEKERMANKEEEAKKDDSSSSDSDSDTETDVEMSYLDSNIIV